jgi:ribosomal protein S18 acetylase RimI-like enzyme
VSVRRVLEIRDGRPIFGDAVGTLLAWDGGRLVVETLKNGAGSRVEIPEESVVAGKVVPPAPVRRGRRAVAAHLAVSAEELQEVAGRGWPGLETARLEAPAEPWALRAGRGFTRRANSALPMGPAPRGRGGDFDVTVGQLREWYAARGLTALVQAVEGSPAAAELEARGWTAGGHAVLRTAPVSALSAADRAGMGGVSLERAPSADWLHRYGKVSDRETAAAVLSAGPSVWFASVPGEDGCAAIGRCVVDGRWAGFAAIEVAPEARRRGLAATVMAALAERAAEEGADLGYLQVEAENEAAGRLYDKLGFAEHHRYHYRRDPGGAN